jgi:hypothetical protein
LDPTTSETASSRTGLQKSYDLNNRRKIFATPSKGAPVSWRADLVDALYGTEVPVLVAVETVIAHCTNKGRAMDGMPSRPARPRVYESKARFTPDDDQLLVDLKDNESLAWKEVISYFPGRTEGSLKKRYAKVKAMPFLEGRGREDGDNGDPMPPARKRRTPSSQQESSPLTQKRHKTGHNSCGFLRPETVRGRTLRELSAECHAFVIEELT